MKKVGMKQKAETLQGGNLKPEGGKQRQKLKSGKLKAEMANQGARNRRIGRARKSYRPWLPPLCDIRFLLSQFQLFSPPVRARAAETLKLERPLSDLVTQTHGLTPAERSWRCKALSVLQTQFNRGIKESEMIVQS
jgi:hypothetical protein